MIFSGGGSNSIKRACSLTFYHGLTPWSRW